MTDVMNEPEHCAKLIVPFLRKQLGVETAVGGRHAG